LSEGKMQRTKQVDLDIRLAELSALVESQRQRIEALERATSQPGVTAEAPARRSRRDLLRLAAATAAGVAGAAALRGVPTQAINGGNLVLGVNNTADAKTDLEQTTASTGGSVPMFQVIGKNAPATAPGVPTVPAGILGTPSGAIQSFAKSSDTGAGQLGDGVDGFVTGAAGYGVYGATDTGFGVVGESVNGISIAALGTGRIAQTPQVAVGPPVFTPGPYQELVRDNNSVIWASRATGANAAAWRRVNSIKVDAADNSGVFKPFRLVDTRFGTGGIVGPLAAGSTTTWTAVPSGTGASTVPASAVAIFGNLTAVAFGGPGWLTILPAGVPYNPAADPSSLNYDPAMGFAVGNSFIIGVGTGVNAGRVSIYVGHTGCHLVLDINGYIE
jgi:hypothetical protein